MLQQFCCELLLPANGGLLLQPEDPQRQLQYLKGREQVAHVSAQHQLQQCCCCCCSGVAGAGGIAMCLPTCAATAVTLPTLLA